MSDADLSAADAPPVVGPSTGNGAAPPSGSAPTADAAPSVPATGDPGTGRRYPLWPLLVMAGVSLVDQIDVSVARGVLPILEDEWGLGDTQLGLITSVFVIVSSVATIPAGWVADHYRRTSVVGWTLLSWTGLIMLSATAVNYVNLLFARAVMGIGQAVDDPASTSFLGDSYPARMRGRVFSFQQVVVLPRRRHRPGPRRLGGRDVGVAVGVRRRRHPRCAGVDRGVPPARAAAGRGRAARVDDVGRDRRAPTPRGRPRLGRRGAERRAVHAAGRDRAGQPAQDDLRHPHDALRAHRRGGAAVHGGGHLDLAADLLRPVRRHVRVEGHCRGGRDVHRRRLARHLRRRRRSPIASTTGGRVGASSSSCGRRCSAPCCT